MRVKDKGKGRAISGLFNAPLPRGALWAKDFEGGGGPDGVVLPLQYISDGPYDVSYTLPVIVGSDSNAQNLSLQVDTGSSDLWIASTSCSSSACSNAPLYNPTTAIPTNDEFSIQYLLGNVSGPIFWDGLTVGGYSIQNQALAAADSVESEPLESKFSGVLGLALPANSIIASKIPPQLGDTPDGAVWMSNLFGITPLSFAPAARFVSLAFERPGSNAVPSILGIGRHPAALVPDPSKIEYDPLYGPSTSGPLFWSGAVRGITVYTNTSRMPIPLGRGVSGAFPSAVLDSGVPVILTTTAVANAIYGAIGVQPAADAMYYLPCTTPLNMTVTLDDRAEIPLHPLDLSTPPGSDAPDPNSCIGLIQASADAKLRNPGSGIGDMVLGIPFLRNVYTVLAYDIPDANGTFPAPIPNVTEEVRPHLGLLNLTDPNKAMEEFHSVRVLNQPLGDSNGSPSATDDASSSRKPSVGIDVLIGLGSFVGLCVLLFGLRWVLVRRSLRRGADDNDLSARDAKSGDLALAGLGGYSYQLAQRGPGVDDRDGLPTEDGMLQTGYRQSLRTVSTDRTQVEPIVDNAGAGGYGKDGGIVKVAEPVQQEQQLPASPRDHSPFLAGTEHSPDRVRHNRGPSINLPLLPGPDAHADADAGAHEDDQNPPSLSMAGVGAFARGRTSLRDRNLSLSRSLDSSS